MSKLEHRRIITDLTKAVLQAVIFLLLLLGWAQPAYSQGNDAIVRMDTPTFEVGLGQVETLVIVLENAQDVYGIDVRAKFDPAYVEVVDVDPAKTGVQMTPGDFPQPDFLVRNQADNQAGTLQYVVTEVNPTLPVNGKGTVLSIQVRGKKMGPSAFTIESVEIADRLGKKLPVHGETGAIAVVTPKPPTPTLTSAVTLATPEPEATRNPEPKNTPELASPTPTPIPVPGGLMNPKTLTWVAVGAISGAVVIFAAAYWLAVRRPPR